MMDEIESNKNKKLISKSQFLICRKIFIFQFSFIQFCTYPFIQSLPVQGNKNAAEGALELIKVGEGKVEPIKLPQSPNKSPQLKILGRRLQKRTLFCLVNIFFPLPHSELPVHQHLVRECADVRAIVLAHLHQH